MSNRLAGENSPYLLQHAENPVDWYPWGEEALEKARREDKPIFLSIGYAACHWCHVMAHESFEDQDTAAILNEHFVSVKVDREERPDLDNIYMSAVTAMTGQGGWPMSVFLTPEGQPFFGGTYFPPVRRYNMPAFREILLTIARLWREDRQQLTQSAQEIARRLMEMQTSIQDSQPLDPAFLDQAAFRLAQSYDWQHGGWGKAPKFPQPMAIEFLLGRAAQGDRMAMDIALHALDTMAKGGTYDVIGGGFARYSTDNQWLIPHFEKMLYDNAQLAQVYLHGYLLSGRQVYRRICCETLDFMRRELAVQHKPTSGGFYSSLDADSEGEEGKFYLWEIEEIRSILRSFQPNLPALKNRSIDWAEFFIQAYDVQPNGNFEGKTVLQRKMDDTALAQNYSLEMDDIPELISQMHERLYKVRAQRVWPALDDKALTAWNSLALIAYAEAGRYLQRQDYTQIARATADFLLTELRVNRKLMRSWRNGNARHNAYLEDIAGLALGLIALYQSDPDVRWFEAAVQLVEEMNEHYSDPAGGFFDTRDDHEALLLRPKDMQDNATPSGNALAALALLQLSIYTGRSDWRARAETMLGAIQEVAARYPTAFAKWLCGLDFALQPIQEVAILGDLTQAGAQALIAVIWEKFRPFCLVAMSSYPPSEKAPMLLKDRPLLNEQATAYVCRNFICRQPVSAADELRKQLDGSI
jgi:uncharacterized protein YyaL (SSP411 family)